MKRSEVRGSITVFLSLTSILFLALICMVVESARVQGARAQTANIIGMGNFSVLGEFEKELLERYEIFALDGAYGSGNFQVSKVENRLEKFLSDNTSPKKDFLSGLCFDPWNLELLETEVNQYALLTDQKGEPFYQQAVAYMKENLEYFALDHLMEYVTKSEDMEDYQKQYKISQQENDSRLEKLESQKQEKIEEILSEKEEDANGTGAIISASSGSGSSELAELMEAESLKNPLDEIKKLKKKSILDIVTWGKEVSDKKISLKGMPSKSSLKGGSMNLEKKNSGITANVLFREYLMIHFPSYVDVEKGNGLDYQMEYLLGGKKSDKENLKYVVNRLLLLREGMNYLYCLGSAQISAQANSLAASLTGFLGMPALTAATGQAIMLAWAYGESLLDVRILLDGGKVPLIKDAKSWSLSLENLCRITELLQKGASDSGEGMDYEEYLRILLHMGTLNNQKMRALDLIQGEIQNSSGMEQFKVQNCIVGVKSSARWNCKTVFLRVPSVIMGLSGSSTVFKQEGSIAY